jgi:hypothetical protein
MKRFLVYFSLFLLGLFALLGICISLYEMIDLLRGSWERM